VRRARSALAIAVAAAFFVAGGFYLGSQDPDNPHIAKIRTSTDHFTCAGIGFIDFGSWLDMPSYYFVDATRSVISSCGYWYRTPLLCPPPIWTAMGCNQKYQAHMWRPPASDAARDRWQMPGEVVAALKIAPTDLVADIRDDRGYFLPYLSRAAPAGRVFAVEYGRAVRYDLELRARHDKLANVVTVDGGERDPRLPGPVDLIVMFGDHTHIDHQRERYFQTLRKWLKPGGRVALIDYHQGHRPTPRASAEQTKQEFAKSGYTLAEEHTFLPTQYFLVFRAGS
jgi:SAM-dependent methyltransferase